MVKWLKLIISLAACMGAGLISGLFTKTGEGSWYASVKKPSFNPPNWLFGPVWTALYLAMGVSLYLLWINTAQTALILFVVQLALNFAWTFIFFTLRSPAWALAEMLLLIVSIALTATYAYPFSKAAALLLAPYLFWVGFATILTASIWKLNARQ